MLKHLVIDVDEYRVHLYAAEAVTENLLKGSRKRQGAGAYWHLLFSKAPASHESGPAASAHLRKEQPTIRNQLGWQRARSESWRIYPKQSLRRVADEIPDVATVGEQDHRIHRAAWLGQVVQD